MLPKDWKCLPLEDIAQVTSGGTPARGTPEYWNGDVPWVTTGEIQFNTITATAEKITEAGLKNSSAKVFPSGTLLIAMYGQGRTRGQVARLGIAAATNQACAAILVKEGYDKDFYYQYLVSQYEAIRELGNAGTQKNLNAGLIKQLIVPVPPLLEQQRISELLHIWDDAILIANTLLANSRKQKQGLMQHLLHRKLHITDQSSSLKYVRLHEVAHRIQRRSDGKEHPILMISSSSGFVRQDEKYNRFMAGKSLDDYVLLKGGEFAYNKGNSKLYEFGCVFPLEAYPQGLVPHVYICFKLNEDCCPQFFKYLFEADYLHDQLGALVNTGVRNNGLLNIRPTDFMNVQVPLLPRSEQESIAAILESASIEIELRKEDLDALKVQKQALMQELLTGKRRLQFPETVGKVAA